jgi:hypothetical protein
MLDEAIVPIVIALTGTAVIVSLVVFYRWVLHRETGLWIALERMRRNQAKRDMTDRAKSGWVALMAGRCPYCCGSGIELTTDATWLDNDDAMPDEPDWEVSDCHFCKGAGVIDDEARERMLGLLKDMRGKKLRTPLDAALSEKDDE